MYKKSANSFTAAGISAIKLEGVEFICVLIAHVCTVVLEKWDFMMEYHLQYCNALSDNSVLNIKHV